MQDKDYIDQNMKQLKIVKAYVSILNHMFNIEEVHPKNDFTLPNTTFFFVCATFVSLLTFGIT